MCPVARFLVWLCAKLIIHNCFIFEVVCPEILLFFPDLCSVSSCVLRWEDPHDSVVYCIDSDGKWMVISGTNRYGVVRMFLAYRGSTTLNLQLL